jgi:hypothetical protein
VQKGFDARDFTLIAFEAFLKAGELRPVCLQADPENSDASPLHDAILHKEKVSGPFTPNARVRSRFAGARCYFFRAIS